MKNKILIALLPFIISCASLNGNASIKETATGVKFSASRPVEMSMEKDGKKYSYSSKSESLLSKIGTALGLGVVGARR